MVRSTIQRFGRFQQENAPCDQRELLTELRRLNKLRDVLFRNGSIGTACLTMA